MTDYLLVHGAAQGAWSWGRVWGLMTAPEEHPPRLYTSRRANKVFPLDLPGHGADAREDTGAVLLDECVHSIVRAVERQGLRDLVLVGHGFAGSLVLEAAGQLPSPPKRIVLVAGIVPDNHKSMQTVLPLFARSCFQLMTTLNRLIGRDVRIPTSVIGRYLCNGLSPMEIVQQLGFFGPLPTRVLKTKVDREETGVPCPLSYVVLTRDRILAPALQRRMAGRLASPEIIELDSGHQATQSHSRELAEILLRYA
ncbi:MAG: alpha/beta fold hydrolase [Dehalococcoidia bacterium]